jgi:hypothetical protein
MCHQVLESFQRDNFLERPVHRIRPVPCAQNLGRFVGQFRV